MIEQILYCMEGLLIGSIMIFFLKIVNGGIITRGGIIFCLVEWIIIVYGFYVMSKLKGSIEEGDINV